MSSTQTTPEIEGRRDRLELRTALYDAALTGDVPWLIRSHQEDEFILDRCSIQNSGHFTQSPLHVAASLGHLEFTQNILDRKPELVEEPDRIRRSTPLHLAVAKGYLQIVKALIAVNPDVCLARNKDGINPAHVAAIRGRDLDMLDELLRANHQAARELTYRGETILHLCVKYRKAEALQHLVKAMDDGELLNSKDSLGNTVLHLAVATTQPQMVKFLVGNSKMDKNAINSNTLTAMDICLDKKKNSCSNEEEEIKQSLKLAHAFPAKAALKSQPKSHTWLENKRNALIVVASLIATMAFQVGINPPGGVWQDDYMQGYPLTGHNAGSSIMADKNPIQFITLAIINTIGLISSLSVIVLLISGLPYNGLFVAILMIIMWIAISATTISYSASVNFLMRFQEFVPTLNVLQQGVLTGSWLLLLSLPLLGHVIRIMVKLIKKLVPYVRKLKPPSLSRSLTRQHHLV